MGTPELIVSIVTASAAIIALIISIIGINKSNRQALFERRLAAYLKIKWMYYLIEPNRVNAETCLNLIDNGPLLGADMLFVSMTNNTYLEEIQPSLERISDEKVQKKFLIKIEDIRSLCEEIRLIFPDSICYDLADFVYYYSEMLVAFYKYKKCIDRISETCEKNKIQFPNDNQIEKAQRMNLKKFLSGTFELGKKLFNTMEKTKSKIKL